MQHVQIRHLLISGLVQGVFYRASLQAEANRLGVAGWCRNRRDGRVEAMAVGDSDAVNALIAWCHQGPAGARVDQVEVSQADAGLDQRDETAGAGFEIRR